MQKQQTRARSRNRRPRSAPARRRSRGLAIYLAGGGLALLALVVVLLSAQRGGEGAAPSQTGNTVDGRQLYLSYCASCHGANLEGQPGWQAKRLAPPHDTSGHTWHHPDAALFQVTKFGSGSMPAFQSSLSDAQIRAILDYIKSTWPPEIRARQRQIH